MGRHEKLPYDSKIEYLRVDETSEGNPYINLNFIPSDFDNDIYCKFQYIDNPRDVGVDDWTIIAGASNANQSIISYGIHRGTYFTWVSNGQNSHSKCPTIGSGNIHEVQLLHDGTFILDGTSRFVEPDTAGNKNTVVARIFNPHKNPCMIVYYLKWYKANKLILDLIPVRIGDEGFMYNKVDGTLFGNAGTGRFILGNDV